MNTALLSAIIASVLATIVLVLPLALALAFLIVAFVPTARLAALPRFLVHRMNRAAATPTITEIPELPAGAGTEPRPDDSDAGDAPALELRRPRRLGYFVIETIHVERTRLLVEMFLERETKRWRLDGSSGNRSAVGHIPRSAVMPSTLLYLVRFRRSSRPETLLDRLKAIGESSDFTVRLECDDELIERSA